MTFFANLAFTPPASSALASTPAFAELVALALRYSVRDGVMAAFTVWDRLGGAHRGCASSRCLFRLVARRPRTGLVHRSPPPLAHPHAPSC